MLPPHITSASSLRTSHEDIRSGFLQQALAKTNKATPFVNEAREFHTALQSVETIESLATIPTTGIRRALLAAAGFSDKALGHLQEAEVGDALKEVLARIASEAGSDWRTEIVYRFLLTRGDTLGGSMRNVTGASGGIQFTAFLTAALERAGTDYQVPPSKKGVSKIMTLLWKSRRLVFDKKIPGFPNNIDAVLTDAADNLLACGELKSGIDPAGADEHWKTARTAFERIRSKYPNTPLFFVGAAIADRMASEIFTDLQAGRLTYAANLTSPEQMADLMDWLISL